jgi:hypothetical protein
VEESQAQRATGTSDATCEGVAGRVQVRRDRRRGRASQVVRDEWVRDKSVDLELASSCASAYRVAELAAGREQRDAPASAVASLPCPGAAGLRALSLADPPKLGGRVAADEEALLAMEVQVRSWSQVETLALSARRELERNEQLELQVKPEQAWPPALQGAVDAVPKEFVQAAELERAAAQAARVSEWFVTEDAVERYCRPLQAEDEWARPWGAGTPPRRPEQRLPSVHSRVPQLETESAPEPAWRLVRVLELARVLRQWPPRSRPGVLLLRPRLQPG